MNLVHLLQTATLARNSDIAISDGQAELNYAQMWKSVNAMALALRKMGIKEGDRIVIMLPNSIDFILAFLAILSIDAIAVPLKQVYLSYELRPIMKEVRPAALIITSAYLKKVLALMPRIGNIGAVVISTKKLVRQYHVPRYMRLDELLKSNHEHSVEHDVTDRLQNTASIHYTYRGFGYPLGAMLTHRNIISGIETFIRTIGLQQGQRSLLCIPAAHVYPLVGCVLSPLLTGGTIVVFPGRSSKDLIEFLQNGRRPIDVIAGVPTLFSELVSRIAKKRHPWAQKVGCVLSGGSFLPTEVYWHVKHVLGWDIRQGYGLTECLPVTCNPLTDNRPETLGQAGWGIKIAIVDTNSQPLSAGQIGEVAISGPTVMAGYFRRKEATSQVLRNGWLYTGDRGLIDSDGYLYFRGVDKHIAKVGGNLVDLKEVEKTIAAHPNTQRVTIATLPDKDWGQIISAQIRLKSDTGEQRVALRVFLKRRLASFKFPRITFA